MVGSDLSIQLYEARGRKPIWRTSVVDGPGVILTREISRRTGFGVAMLAIFAGRGDFGVGLLCVAM